MNAKSFIELPTPHGSEIINPEDIISVHALDKHICLCVENQKEKKVKLPIGRAEELLNYPWFVRCHRCHIINVLKIKEIVCNDATIKLSNDKIVPVSDSYKQKFRNTLNQYCKKLGGGKLLIFNQ